MSYFVLDNLPGRTALAKGKEYLFFSGYAYLGIQHTAEFKTLVKEGLDKYGWLFPSSRISNTRIGLFEECENLLSSITKNEDTVLVSSGYTAGRLATAMFEHDIVNLRPSHPAIKRDNADKGKGIYAVDAINILTAEVTDINKIHTVTPLNTLMIDDSHGIGLTGSHGEGASSYLEKKEGIGYVFTYSLSKAWGINAGAISCNAPMAAKYRTMPAYTGATAPSQAQLYAFIKGQHIYAAQREKLRKNIQYFKAVVADLPGVINESTLPVFVLPARINEDVLAAKNIIISSFAYPDPSGTKIQRVVLNALHTKSDLDYLAECLRQMW